ncbi:MAG: PIN domain-containing protein [Bacteroidota bacterium]
MMHIFIDTNVVIDFLANREPFSTEAAEIFELCESGKLIAYTAAVSFNNIYYILRQKTGHDATIIALQELASLVAIMDVTSNIIRQALSSGNSDFEDAIQYYTAITSNGIEAIITRDPRGFRNSNIRVLSPAEFLAELR